MNILNRTSLLFVAYAFVVSGCGSSSSNGFADSGAPDAGNPVDSGGNAPVDSSIADTAVPPQVDAGTPQHDSSSPVDSGNPDDTGEPTYDFGCGGNTACPINQVCCTIIGDAGAASSFACIDPASCPAGDKISCDGPDECVGTATPVCCGVAIGNGTGTFPACGASSLGTSCSTAASCVTHIGSCSATTKTQICHTSADCTDPNNPQCCTFTNNGASVTFCIDSTSAALGGGVCH